MAVVVYHSSYGCDTGCCGHRIQVDGREADFDFDHPFNEDPRTWAERFIRERLGDEHVADLDWENSLVLED